MDFYKAEIYVVLIISVQFRGTSPSLFRLSFRFKLAINEADLVLDSYEKMKPFERHPLPPTNILSPRRKPPYIVYCMLSGPCIVVRFD